MPLRLHRMLAALALAIASTQSSAAAQSRSPDSTFADLSRDGNGVAALLRPITAGFSGQTAEAAFKAIAATARLSFTLDPRLSGMQSRITIPSSVRSAAVALIEVADASNLRVRVSPSGQIIVVEARASAPAARSATPDTTRRDPVVLAAVHAEAERLERVRFASRTDVGGISITGRELRSAPAFVEPDVLRSVQLMPGISARSDYTAGFNVRGGENDQNLILIDGYPIYSPFHFGGIFSTFIDATVGRVELHRGGMPVQYGGRLSGVIDVSPAEPTSTGTHGTAEVSLVSSSASVGRVFADGAGSWMIAARRTYADAIVNRFSSDTFPYHFQDGQAHVARSWANGVRMSATAYAGADVLTPVLNYSFDNWWGNGVAGVTAAKRFDNARLFGIRLGDSVTIEQRASLTRFSSQIAIPEIVYLATDRVTDRRLAGSIAAHSAGSTRTLGYELSFQDLDYHSNSSFAGLADIIPFDSIRQQSRASSVYADQLWRPTTKLLLQVGGRVDAVQASDWIGFSPRVSMKYWLDRNLAVTAAAGSYAQWMHSLGREEEPIQPIQFWIASDSTLPVSRSHDAIVGVERWMNPTRFFHVEAFYKRYDDLLTPNPYNDAGVRGDEFYRARGASYGADVMLRQLDGGPFSGWLAYTYSVSTRERADGLRYFPTQDRRHNLNLVGSWRSGAYTLGARANIASGLPGTPLIGGYIRARYDPIARRWTPDATFDEQVIPGEYNSVRFPKYSRIDVSATRAGRMWGASVSPYLSVVNLLNAHNPAGFLYDYSTRSNRASVPNLPFAPTLGVSIAY
ncbi:MAG: TonB-dependent receptor plug domain-containing protein [Gemmatimonadota bacterium]